MMDVLQYKLDELLLDVGVERAVLRHLQHGDFRPAEQPVLIAAIVGVLRMLVVAQADRIGADLADQRKVLVDLLPAHGGKHAGAVLMLGDATELYVLAVEA